jgi:bacillithiol synthase
MNSTNLPFDLGNHFSLFDQDYTLHQKKFDKFYQYSPDYEGLVQSIENRKNYPIDRYLLVEELRKQYDSFHSLDDVGNHIDKLLDQNTFTVITAHQPCLFTGPFYFIYKAISAIKLSEILNSQILGSSILPVMIIGGEDHDKDEIDHLYLFGKKITWNTEQSGPCGRFNTKGLDTVISDIKDILGNGAYAENITNTLQTCFLKAESYSQGLQHFMHLLLGHKGLLILNMDVPAFKEKFIPIIKDEILNKRAEKLITPIQQELEDIGYKAATFLRHINLFYFNKGQRERIEFENGKYIVLNGGPEFTESEIIEEINNHPEKFSPNVNLRPLYQECILPGIAYVGGGGELAYWMERKGHFTYYDIPMPCLIRRDSVWWIDKTTVKRIDKLGLSIIEFLEHTTDEIISNFLEYNSESSIHIDEEILAIKNSLDSIIRKGAEIDATLKPAFEAEKTRFIKSVEQLGGRLIRAEKQKQEIHINQIRQIREKLFPDGKLQERHENFLSVYIKHGPAMFDILLNQLDPLRKELKIILEAG